MQVFDSFELMAGEEVEQVILAALRALVAQAEEPKTSKRKRTIISSRRRSRRNHMRFLVSR
jgi:hypothetical protein